MCYFWLKMADKQIEKAGQCVLPLSRIRTIMKSSPDVGSISHEALFLTGKATEMFVKNLTNISREKSKDKMNVNYKDLAEVVNTDDVLQFLQDIIPRKIKAKDYLDQLEDEEEDSS
uniref:Chromatin accessibility complex protein 1 n=1 Tax=Crassostrea virginica TaxID=6565 RepID=A0A8B8ABX0_CRAVI|nr:chromatin accessibility complex protein 1-like isoform X1 [Crassostrea virginica]XP_022288972.1 chromatin accessibility complex protein 1-like isoform X2 [Crassostrea virginica]